MVSKVQSSEATLPYELLALESSLAAHTKMLEAETAELEGQAKPSLERLLLSVCAHPKPSAVRLAGHVCVSLILLDVTEIDILWRQWLRCCKDLTEHCMARSPGGS